jgi:hypothetical protein
MNEEGLFGELKLLGARCQDCLALSFDVRKIEVDSPCVVVFFGRRMFEEVVIFGRLRQAE